MKKEKNKRVRYFKEYILKDIFLHELKIYEVRLCIFLTSKMTTLSDMTYEDKMWVCGSKREYAKLKEAEQHLINLGLLNKDGTGLQLDGREFIQNKNINVVDSKTQRELFLRCLKYWYKGKNIVYVKKEYIYAMLGKSTGRINENIKRVKSSIGLEINIEKKNSMYIATFKPKQYKTPYIPYNEYLQTEHWRTISKEYKDKYGKCQLCGSTKGLNVHHNNYDCLFHETDKDLIVLCSECHKKFHDIS